MKKVVLIVFGLFLISQVLALEVKSSADTTILVNGVDNQITLTMMIQDAPVGNYNVYTLSDIIITPSEVFEIKNGSAIKEFVLSASDNLKAKGPYAFTYTLNRRGYEKYDSKLTLNLMELEQVVEVSSDNINASSNEISFYVKNLQNVHLKGLKANFKSILFDVDQSFDLGPYEKKVFSVVVDNYKFKRTKTGVYVIDSTFMTSEGNKEIAGTLFLGENKGISSTEEKSGLLVQEHSIMKVNAGNTVESVRTEIQKNIFSRLFTTFETEPNLVERKGFIITYTWTKERFSPADVLLVQATTNYVLPFFIVLFIIVAIVVIKRINPEMVSIKKSVSPVRTKNGEFALKVTLTVRALRSVQNMSVSDSIPRVVKLFNKFSGVQPSKIDPHTRTVHWNMGSLSPKEVRIMSYVVYSKVGVIGKVSVPPARASFEKDYQHHQVSSNSVFFMNEQTNTEN